MLGWSVRAVATSLGRSAPAVGWLHVVGLALGAVIVAATAWRTRRAVRRRSGDLRSHEAVNRLVLGKACALVGALLVGGYAGAALSWVGAISARADGNVLRSGLAAAATLGLLAAGLALERACRVQDDPPPP